MNSLSWMHVGMGLFFAGIFIFVYQINKKKSILLWRELLASCKITYRSFWTTIFLPIVLPVLLWISLMCATGASSAGDAGSIGDIAVRSTVTPFWEEMAFRGVLIGTVAIGLLLPWLERKLKRQLSSDERFNYLLAVLFVTSVLFSFFHYGKLDLRYFAGLLYGILYLLDKRNLTAPILGHATWNFILIVITSCPAR